MWLFNSQEITAAEINNLPEKLRRYIHDLETRSDPADDLQTIASLAEQRDALVAKMRELKAGGK